MTRQPCCGSRTPHPTRFQARIGGPRYGGRYPWAHGLFPIGGVAPPCTDPSYARGQEFRRSLPSCAPPSSRPREAGSSHSSRVSPTPHVYSWASALGLWGTGNRVPSFPDHRRRGKAQGPYPAFGTDSRSIAAPTFPGRPTSSPGFPQVWSEVERRPLGLHAPR